MKKCPSCNGNLIIGTGCLECATCGTVYVTNSWLPGNGLLQGVHSEPLSNDRPLLTSDMDHDMGLDK